MYKFHNKMIEQGPEKIPACTRIQTHDLLTVAFLQAPGLMVNEKGTNCKSVRRDKQLQRFKKKNFFDRAPIIIVWTASLSSLLPLLLFVFVFFSQWTFLVEKKKKSFRENLNGRKINLFPLPMKKSQPKLFSLFLLKWCFRQSCRRACWSELRLDERRAQLFKARALNEELELNPGLSVIGIKPSSGQ